MESLERTYKVITSAKKSVNNFNYNGKIEYYFDLPSKFIDSRNIEVWIPQDYDSNKRQHYPVLYMHDGQNLFDPSTSYIGVDWSVHSAIEKLIYENKVKETIVVGIWNNSKRMNEYMPEKALNMLSLKEQSKCIDSKLGCLSDNYLKFIVRELKPFIDKNYRTIKTENYVSGSSMGGLISLYALCEYPYIFSGAACISTHWPIGNGIVLDYMKEMLPNPGKHKIYFDYGTKTADSVYEPFQKKADKIMEKAGYQFDEDWITIKFNGEEHSERAWKRRMHIPLLFLLE